MLKKIVKRIALILITILLVLLFGLFTGWIVMLLWNWLMPSIFGLKTITYWQGWGLIILFYILSNPLKVSKKNP